jgi:hypothetical protein
VEPFAPAGLLEFRYFLIQAMLLLIHQPLPHAPPPDRADRKTANPPGADSRHGGSLGLPEGPRADRKTPNPPGSTPSPRRAPAGLGRGAVPAGSLAPPDSLGGRLGLPEGVRIPGLGGVVGVGDVLGVVGFAVLDGVMAGVFLLRPFTWPDGSVARFMW